MTNESEGSNAVEGDREDRMRPPPPPAPIEVPDSADQPSEKVCPRCAATVPPEALICRHCRYDWRTDSFSDLRPRTNGVAAASLAVGVVSVMLFPLVPLSAAGGLLAIVMGAVARRQIKRSNGALAGREMAGFGLVLGIVALAVAATLTILALVLDIEFVTVDVSGF